LSFKFNWYHYTKELIGTAAALVTALVHAHPATPDDEPLVGARRGSKEEHPPICPTPTFFLFVVISMFWFC
jgi:hypothetical protein